MSNARVIPAKPWLMVNTLTESDKSQMKVAPNTTVTQEARHGGIAYVVRLHGHEIAMIYRLGGSGRLSLKVTSAGYPTKLTAARLDAIVSAHTDGLYRIGRKNGGLEVRMRNGAGGFTCRPMVDGEIFGEVV